MPQFLITILLEEEECLKRQTRTNLVVACLIGGLLNAIDTNSESATITIVGFSK
jgi:hypothetical protein